MRRFFAVASVAVLTFCLAGWVALVWADPYPVPAPSQPAQPVANPLLPALPTAPDMSRPLLPAPMPSTGKIQPALFNPSAEQVLPLAPDPTAQGAMPVATPPSTASAPLPSLPLVSPAGPSTALAPALPSIPTLPPAPTPPGLPPAPAPTPSPDKSRYQVPAPAERFIPPAPAVPTTAMPINATPAAPANLVPANEVNVPAPQESRPADMTPTRESSAGRQESMISTEWVYPSTIKVGVQADYSLLVRNTGSSPVQQVMARVRLPATLNVVGTEPTATSENNVYSWDLGTLAPKQEKNLTLRMVARSRGEVSPEAWVTATATSTAVIKVREPKLVVKASAPEKVPIGDAVTFALAISNPGDGPAEQVKIHAGLTEGLKVEPGSNVDVTIGNLAAGETRNVQIVCSARNGGAQRCEAVAEAEGCPPAKDSTGVNVIMPKLEMVMSGPALRYLDRKAVYTIKVSNQGEAPASNVTVADLVPAGFKVLAASDNGQQDPSTRTVSWLVGDIGIGQSKEVKLEVQAVNTGEHVHKASAVAARGVRADSDLATRVEGLSALLLELVDTEDPVETGGETTYEIHIANTGSIAETGVKLVASVPESMAYKTSAGPTKGREGPGRTVVFEPIDKLEPRADVFYRVVVKCNEPGTVHFKIQVTSNNLPEPAIKMEATRIYSDAPTARR